MKYGVSYMGSKNSIAKDIIDFLPEGNRLVDLFGGGFAITHCALTENKYNEYLYNDYNPLIVNLVKKAINGDYNYKVFKPKWVSREDFFKLKEEDGYIKYCWSFSNQGRSYLNGKDIENQKRDLFNYVVWNTKTKWVEDNFPGIDNYITSEDIHERRLELKKFFKVVLNTRCDLQSLERLERLQSLERLERLQSLESLENLEITNISYENYVHKTGDVVYCDIPYENCKGQYDETFDHKKFYDWCCSKDYPIYFSSYEISDDRFVKVWSKKKRSLMNGAQTLLYKEECVYAQKHLYKGE